MYRIASTLFLAVVTISAFTQTIQLPDPNDCSPTVTALDCGTATFNNTSFATGEEYIGSLMAPYTGGNEGIHPALSISSTGVTGITADLLAGSLTDATGNLIFYLHGTPSAAGAASFDISYGGQTCAATVTLTEEASSSPTPVFNQAIAACDALPPAYSDFHFGDLAVGAVWVGQNGIVYGSGDNGTGGGRLGWPKGAVILSTPLPIRSLLKETTEPFISVTGSSSITSGAIYYGAISETGRLFIFGCGAENTAIEAIKGGPSASTAPSEEDRVESVEIAAPTGATGWDFIKLSTTTNSGAIAKADNGEWYAWGSGMYETANSRVCMLFNEGCPSTVGATLWETNPQLTTRLNPKPRADQFSVQLFHDRLFYISEDGDPYVYGEFDGSYYSAPQQISIGSAKAKKILSSPVGSAEDDLVILDEDGNIWLAGDIGSGSTGVMLNIPSTTFLDFSTWGTAYTRIAALTSDGDLIRVQLSNGAITTYDEGTSAYSNTNFVRVMDNGATSFVLVSDDGTHWTYDINSSATNTEYPSGNWNRQSGSEPFSIVAKERSPWPWISCSNSTYVPQNGTGVQ